MSGMSVNSNGAKCLLAIAAITIMAIVTVQEGLDGQVIWLAILAIAGLGGYDLYAEQKARATVVSK